MTKLFKLLFILTMITTIFACNPDDEPDPEINPFLGSWLLVENSSNSVINTTSNGVTSTFESSATFDNSTYIFDFIDQNNYTVSGGYDFIETVTVNGSSQTQTTTLTDFSESGTYSYTDDFFTTNPADSICYYVNGNPFKLPGDESTQQYVTNTAGDVVFSTIIDSTYILDDILYEIVGSTETRFEKQ